jgi:hypothetical protein
LTVGEWWDTSFGTVLSEGWKTEIDTNRKQEDRRKVKVKVKVKCSRYRPNWPRGWIEV